MKRITTIFLTLMMIHGLNSQLNMIETEEMSLVTYSFGHQYILPHAGRCFHRALDFHKELFDYTPTEKITVLIQDFGDYGNAGATAVPRNAISMGLSPFSYTFETSPAGERVFSMMNHELVHVVALDNATKSDRFYQKLFAGKVDPTNDHPISMFYSLLTSPRRYSPRWYHEGIASYVETWMNGGIGLAMGNYDEMVFRTRVLEEARIYSAQGLESEGVTSDFQGRSNSYLYGTRFMGYLAYQYGPEKIIEWVKRNEGSKRFFAGQFKHVFGKSINQGWDEWIAFENEWQNQNLKELSTYPVTPMEVISNKTLGSVSYAHFDQNRNLIYAAVNYPGQNPHLASINLESGKVKKLTDIKGAALFYVSSVTYDPDRELIFYTTDNDSWRDLNVYHIKTGKTEVLQKDVRTGDIAYNQNDQSIWGIKHLNGFSTIVKIPYRDTIDNSSELYNTWDQKHTLEYGQDIFDIDISPDGRIMSAAVSDLDGNQYLLFYDLEALENEQAVIDTVFNFDVSSPQSFRFSDDGKYLYGSSYYTSVSNIFRVETESKDIEAMSNALTGLFRPVVIDDERLFAFNFTSNGFQPVYIPNQTINDINSIEYLGNVTIEKYPELQDWQITIPSATELDIESLKINEGVYQPGKELHVNYAYPTIVGYKNHVGIGYQMHLSDPFRFREFDLSIAYTPKSFRNGLSRSLGDAFSELEDDELIHISVSAEIGKFSISGGYNEADFYDLFGPTKSGRKGLNLGVNFEESLLYDPPHHLDLNVGLSGFYGLDQSPEFQQIVLSGFNRNFFLNASASLSYRYLTSSLGGVDAEKGVSATLWGSTAWSAGNLYPRVIGLFNYGIQLPVNHMSLWFRTAAGYSFSETFNPFTRFGFAAFGNNYVDYQSTRRYRGAFSFPGVSFEAERSIIAREFGKATAELVLPPIRFRKVGGFNFYANWIQPSIFSSLLWSKNANFPAEKFNNLGAQLDLRMVMFSLLPSTLSVGYAKAWEIDGPDRFDEWMISLKLLR